ncbi:MAG: TIGR04282 family arsenosugar biosynthesis glycosyltransferase [Pirellulaceae bacterium]|nr:TIGR04282 family arsenosugar biosynthesis glycosyltransferase [Pirellulaceae bacterium]
MFAKFWAPGQVKTRLAAHIGPAAASRLYRTFLTTLLWRFHRIGGQRVLVYSPGDRRAAFEMLATGRLAGPHRPLARQSATAGDWRLAPQGAGDLGQRMRRYFQRTFSQGVRRAVLIGSDSPTLPTRYVLRAFELLRSHDVVLGPCGDGGYYLIGARDRVPPVFDDMPWSTPQVWPRTVERLASGGWSLAQLAPWYDIDDLEGLNRLRAELSQSPAQGSLRSLAAAVASIRQQAG